MRIRLTLDGDIAAQIKAEKKRSGQSLNETVNAYLRSGLQARKHSRSTRPFVVRARRLKPLPGLNFDNVTGLVERAEGPCHR